MSWYTGDTTYDTLLAIGFVFAAAIALASMFGQSAYGRFGATQKGINLNPKVGWILMELPAPITFAYVFFQGKNHTELVPLLFLGVWMCHYANRGFITPLLMRVHSSAKASFSLSVVLFGWVATGLHGYFSAWFISELAPFLTPDWLTDPRFIIGFAIYLIGVTLNVHSDAVLRSLRPKLGSAADTRDQPRYRIPYGGGYRFVSSPSYLGEMLAWLGFAIFTWSLAGVFILAVTVANLLPRALATHRWYQENFDDYPSKRKSLIPFLL
jgi:3-oxo-5-alpha-steroid 4-dehydrogenase 1